MQQDIICSRCKTMESSQACKCGGTITTYCDTCIEDHLKNTAINHEIINFCYANNLEKEASSIKEILDTANADLNNYQSQVNFFKDHLSSITSKIERKLPRLIQDSLRTLDSITSDITYKRAMLENHLAFQRYEASVMLDRYKEYGLRGILNRYIRDFAVLEEDLMVILDNLVQMGEECNGSIIKQKDQKIAQLEETVNNLRGELGYKDGLVRDLTNKLQESIRDCDRLKDENQNRYQTHEIENRMTQVPSSDSIKS